MRDEINKDLEFNPNYRPHQYRTHTDHRGSALPTGRPTPRLNALIHKISLNAGADPNIHIDDVAEVIDDYRTARNTYMGIEQNPSGSGGRVFKPTYEEYNDSKVIASNLGVEIGDMFKMRRF